MIELKSGKLYFTGGVEIDNPHHVTIPGGLTVVGGSNGAGKTTLAKILAGGWNFRTNSLSSPHGKLDVNLLEFSDIHSLAGFSSTYYQQRYESSMNDDVPTVREVIGAATDTGEWERLTRLMRLCGAESKKINYLSSGELRKLLIIDRLLRHPHLLILDNPYIGLDAGSRDALNDALGRLVADGMNVMLLLCDPAEIPPCATALIPMRDRCIMPSVGGETAAMKAAMSSLMDYSVDISTLPPAPPRAGAEALTVVRMEHCDVKYGRQLIIGDVDWEIGRGERWALTGPNGSGKSTLLSLIHADNPQRYSNRIALFDSPGRKGESIWDIKRRIGYISPEMHLYFNGGGDVAAIIAQGLNDTVGLYVKIEPWQAQLAARWMAFLGIGHLAKRKFNTLSTGEQRMALLARAFIKQPELLILDEPLHGLDAARKQAIRAIISRLATSAERPTALIYVTHYPAETPDCVTRVKSLQRRY